MILLLGTNTHSMAILVLMFTRGTGLRPILILHLVKGVDLLLRPVEAVVQEVREDENALVLDHSFDLQVDCPVVCNGTKVDVIHAEADCLWVTDLANITPGNKITQLSQV